MEFLGDKPSQHRVARPSATATMKSPGDKPNLCTGLASSLHPHMVRPQSPEALPTSTPPHPQAFKAGFHTSPNSTAAPKNGFASHNAQLDFTKPAVKAYEGIGAPPPDRTLARRALEDPQILAGYISRCLQKEGIEMSEIAMLRLYSLVTSEEFTDSLGSTVANEIRNHTLQEKAKLGAHPQIYAQPKMYPQPEIYPQPETYAQPETHTQPEIYAQPKTYPQPEIYAQPETYAQPKMYLQSKMYPQPKIYVQSKTNARPKTNVQSKTNARPKINVRPKNNARPKTNARPRSNARPISSSQSMSNAQPTNNDQPMSNLPSFMRPMLTADSDLPHKSQKAAQVSPSPTPQSTWAELRLPPLSTHLSSSSDMTGSNVQHPGQEEWQAGLRLPPLSTHLPSGSDMTGKHALHPDLAGFQAYDPLLKLKGNFASCSLLLCGPGYHPPSSMRIRGEAAYGN